MTSPLTPWSIRAVNLAEHGDNPVHTDAGGRAAGYDGAVVAGTTIYAYLTRPAAQGWGLDWVTGGGAEVRFRAAVLADELLDVDPADDGTSIIARVGDRECAVMSPTRSAVGELPSPVGERLEPLVEVLDERWAGYGARAGEDLPLYDEEDLVHPVVWTCLANRIFTTQLVDGAWVHTRSRVAHLGRVTRGSTALVEAWLTDRFTTWAGERAVVDVRVSVDGRPVAAIEHEALVALA